MTAETESCNGAGNQSREGCGDPADGSRVRGPALSAARSGRQCVKPGQLAAIATAESEGRFQFRNRYFSFIAHSRNKVGGTAKQQEHRTNSFVVGAGNADT